MGRYDRLMEEVEAWPWQPGSDKDSLMKSFKECISRSKNIGAAFQRRAAKATKNLRSIQIRSHQASIAAQRAAFADLNQRSVALANSGELSGIQGAILDNALDRYARVLFK